MWLIEHRDARPSAPSVEWYLDYEFPLHEPRCVRVTSQEGEVVFVSPIKMGEADVTCLPYVTQFHDMGHASVQIDSDVIPIALMYLHRTHLHPPAWIWTTINYPWTNQSDPCYDLLKLYHGIRNDTSILCEDRVLCFVMGMCILNETDFYQSKQLFSPYVNFDHLFSAVQSNWELWVMLIEWWNDTRALRCDDVVQWDEMRNRFNREGLGYVLNAHTKWQWHHLLVSKAADDNWLRELDEPLPIAEYKTRLQLRKVKLTRYKCWEDLDKNEMETINAQLWFNWMYWTCPEMA